MSYAAQIPLEFPAEETSDLLERWYRNRSDLQKAESDKKSIATRIKMLTEEGEHIDAELASLVTEARQRQKLENETASRSSETIPAPSEDDDPFETELGEEREPHIAFDPLSRPALGEPAIDAEFTDADDAEWEANLAERFAAKQTAAGLAVPA